MSYKQSDKKNTADFFVETARAEAGAKSGEKYVKRYNEITGNGIPLSSFWCACFVTWAADVAGVPHTSIKPFCSCSEEVRWFKSQSRWQGRGFIPSKGDVIFFDWDNVPDGDHVGIVEYVIGNRVHTIEGNAGNNGTCMRRSYPLGSSLILGYGIPKWSIEKEKEMTYDEFKAFMKKYESELEKKDVSSWAKESWEKLCDANIFDGTMPRSGLTREQAAIIIERLAVDSFAQN